MDAFGPGDRPHREEAGRVTAPADRSAGRLQSRLQPPTVPPAPPGLHKLNFGGGRDGLLYVPTTYRPANPAPFMVLLHGAGGDARGGIDPLLPFADEAGLLLLAPDSRDTTWDVIVGSFGPDVTFIDRALAHVFARYTVDPTRLGVGGFSDGGSYALSVGLTNGDLFTHVIAFSPGFAAPGEAVGQPDIFITHGVYDRVLPIDRTSRRLHLRLQRDGHRVVYEEFPDGHVVPTDRARRALDWFVQ
ncbi:phospholipase/carboxylesterase [Mycobacterium sp. URHB0021]